MNESILDQTSDRRAGSALKSGVYARKLLVSGEQEAALLALREELVGDWRPRNATEWLLVDQIARLQWRLLRVEEAEGVRLEALQRKSKFPGCERDEPMPVEEALAGELVRIDSGLHRMQMFQMRIERAIHRSISQLLTIRRSRRKSGPQKMGKLQQQRAPQISAQAEPPSVVVENARNENGRNKFVTPVAQRPLQVGVSPPARPLPALSTTGDGTAN